MNTLMPNSFQLLQYGPKNARLPIIAGVRSMCFILRPVNKENTKHTPWTIGHNICVPVFWGNLWTPTGEQFYIVSNGLHFRNKPGISADCTCVCRYIIYEQCCCTSECLHIGHLSYSSDHLCELIILSLVTYKFDHEY
jgi:hypothetical protein